jgi:hypothetical protein
MFPAEHFEASFGQGVSEVLVCRDACFVLRK